MYLTLIYFTRKTFKHFTIHHLKKKLVENFSIFLDKYF